MMPGYMNVKYEDVLTGKKLLRFEGSYAFISTLRRVPEDCLIVKVNALHPIEN